MNELDIYKGLLHLVSGISLFVIMLLTMRLMARVRRTEEAPTGGMDRWIVCGIVEETHNIKTFILRAAGERRFPRFKAGQFLTFLLNGNAKKVRSYSISSSENNRRSLHVSVKRIDGGEGSSWFHTVKVGDELTTFPPSGHFFDQHPPELKRVYIAGGVGVTPVLSMIRSRLERADAISMTLFYGVREQRDLAFHDIFESLSKRHANFKYIPVLSHDNAWPGHKGYLTQEFVRQHLSTLDQTVFFICGPEPMADPLIDGLIASGVSEEFIHNEKFISPTLIDPSKIPVRQARVVWAGHSYTYYGQMNLLEFLESQGQAIPYACRTGVCGTCKCKITGPVKTLTHAGLSRHEQKEGWTLACVSYPEGDVEISLAP